MEKFEIKNRRDQRIVGVVDHAHTSKGIVIFQHGLGGYREQLHIVAMAQAYYDLGYTVVRFDSTHGTGESDGTLPDLIFTYHKDDLEDVITWAKQQDWFISPYHLAGHSIGSMSIILYAGQNPQEIASIVAVSSVVGGQFWVEATKEYFPERWDQVQTNGFFLKADKRNPSKKDKVSKAYIDDLVKYDARDKAENLTMPTLLIWGEDDIATKISNEKLFEKLPEPKTFIIQNNCPHTQRSLQQLSDLTNHIETWLKDITS